MKKEKCSAWGQTCKQCGKANHFASMCSKLKKTGPKQKKRVNLVHDPQSDSDCATDEDAEWINIVNSNVRSKEVKCILTVGKTDVIFQVDTGASVNILPERFIDSRKIVAIHKTLQMWNGTELVPQGMARIKLTNPKNSRKYSVEFVIVKDNFVPLIGLKAAEQMKLITVNHENVRDMTK